MTGALPTRVDNALYQCITHVDLENLFLDISFEMRIEIRSIPICVDLDNGGSALRITHPYP